MKNKEIIKTLLADIWRNYKSLAFIYPVFAILLWLNWGELEYYIFWKIILPLISFGGVLMILGYGIKQFVKLKREKK